MIKLIRAGARHYADRGWLKTYWLFSFDDYFDPENIEWGALRVFNDDTVAPGRGFGSHPHKEMEIVTMVLGGELTHEDSMGNMGVIGAGDVQRMSAGTGVIHSEMNKGSEPVHLFQIWIRPSTFGLVPSYDQRNYDPSCWRNQLCPIVSGQEIPNTVSMHCDGTIYRASLDAGEGIRYESSPGRRIFLYLVSGKLQLDGEILESGDQARMGIEWVQMDAIEKSHLVLIDVPT